MENLDTLFKLRDAIEKAIEEHGDMPVTVLACYGAHGPITGTGYGVGYYEDMFCLITDIMTG